MTFDTSEISLEQIVKHMPGNVYWKNREGVYLGCNDNMVEAFCKTCREEVIGKELYELTDKENADKTTSIDNAVMRNNKEFSKEEDGYDLNGKPAVYLTRKIPLHDKRGNVVGLLGMSFDITERKNMEKALIAAKESAEASDQKKVDFIRNMEHDFRTPLAGIVSVSELLLRRKKNEDEEEKFFLSSIGDCAKELMNFFNNIIGLTKTLTDDTTPTERTFNLNELIEGIISMHKPIAQQKNIYLIKESDSAVPSELIGDDASLQKILVNLVSNAVKFTSEGGVKIITSVLNQSINSNVTLQISVQDTGIGIPKAKQNIIFDKFVRLSPSNKGLFKGTGLGLHAVKETIEELGGEINVKSEESVGTTFSLSLVMKTSN